MAARRLHTTLSGLLDAGITGERTEWAEWPALIEESTMIPMGAMKLGSGESGIEPHTGDFRHTPHKMKLRHTDKDGAFRWYTTERIVYWEGKALLARFNFSFLFALPVSVP